MEFLSAELATQLVASLLFILSLAGLSQHETAKRGLNFGIVGMGLALLATVGRLSARTRVPAATVSRSPGSSCGSCSALLP